MSFGCGCQYKFSQKVKERTSRSGVKFPVAELSGEWKRRASFLGSKAETLWKTS